MVPKKGTLAEIAIATNSAPIASGSSHYNDSPIGESDSDSGSPSLASTATHSDNEDVPNDLNIQEDGSQKGKGRKRVIGKEPRTRKKGQKFQCTGYGDCNLCFTRSEHLSRHIRKHTGEKPYKCFCDRDFSRLDNLRQHAFTVHDASEIPPGWEHAVKCQSKTAKNTEGRRKEVSIRKSRKREVRAKNVVTTPSPVTPNPQPASVHQPAMKGTPQVQAQSNNYHEYSQSQLQHQQIPVHHQHGAMHPQQSLMHHQNPVHHQSPVHQQLPIHPPGPLHRQQTPVHRQQTPVQHHQGSSVPSQVYHVSTQSPVRVRPQSLILPSQGHPQESAFQGYRHTTPPQSPQSTPQTPRGVYNNANESTLTTPTSANFHHRNSFSTSGIPTPNGGWTDTNRRLSMPYGGGIEYGSVHSPSPRTPIPRPRRDPLEMEENRRKRMTWHGGEDAAIGNIVSPLESTHLDDPRPLRRPRASTYMPAAAPTNLATMALPSVESLLNPVASTPRTIPIVPSALSPRAAERRPSSARYEHSRSRSASHIQPNGIDAYTSLPPRTSYHENLAERLAEVRGQRRHPLAGPKFGSPEGPSQDANGIFKDPLTFRHSRSDSSEGLPPPRPMEPSFGAARPEFAPEKSKDAGFIFVDRQPHTVPTARPRARTSAGTNGDMAKFTFPPRPVPKMDIFEPGNLRGEPEMKNLDFLATVCNQRIEEEKPRRNSIGK